MKKSFQGICAVTVTPFHQDGSFDFDAAKRHLDWLLERGIKFFCLLGATGEYQSVTNDEHKAYVKEIAPYLSDKATIIVGVSRERPDDVIDLMKNAKEYGADGAMVLPPFYYPPSQEEIFEHYRYINDQVDLPIVVYNNPGSANVDIEKETFEKILTLKNALLIKESTGSMQRLTEALMLAKENTTVLCGCDNMSFESFAVGAHGWISMASNFAPRDCVELYEAVAIRKDFEKGKEIYRRLLPALTLLENFRPSQAIKYILNELRGVPVGYVRRPRIELTEEEKAFVRETIQIDTIN